MLVVLNPTVCYGIQKMNTVNYLINKPFSTHPLNDKLVIKDLGRPNPDIKLEQSYLIKGKVVISTRKSIQNMTACVVVR